MKTFPENWRLILSEPKGGYDNMAIDYSILKSVAQTGVPTLRLYSWEKPTLTIGYFQSVNDEVNLDYLKKNKIDLIRRITGGGAVLHDNELTYSFFIPVSFDSMKCSVEESFKKIAQPLILALNNMGLNASFSGLNDISIKNKKISGNAQTRKEKVILQHGTILLSVNEKLMFNCLKISKEKLKDKAIQEPAKRITSLVEEITEDFDLMQATDILKNEIIKAYENLFEVSFSNKPVTKKELSVAVELKTKFFNNKEWNFKR